MRGNPPPEILSLQQIPNKRAEFCLALRLLKRGWLHSSFQPMARKLYIFKPTTKQRTEGRANSPMKWLGGFSANYAYLGDAQARMLGVGKTPSGRPVPVWFSTANAAVAATKAARGGASRLDRDFRGWG